MLRELFVNYLTLKAKPPNGDIAKAKILLGVTCLGDITARSLVKSSTF